MVSDFGPHDTYSELSKRFSIFFNTWFFNTQAEDVGHISAGVGSDGAVVVLLSPLDQGLRSCRQLLLHRLRHLHQSLGAGIQANAV